MKERISSLLETVTSQPFGKRFLLESLRFLRLVPILPEDAPIWQKELSIRDHLEETGRRLTNTIIIYVISGIGMLTFWKKKTVSDYTTLQEYLLSRTVDISSGSNNLFKNPPCNN